MQDHPKTCNLLPKTKYYLKIWAKLEKLTIFGKKTPFWTPQPHEMKKICTKNGS